MRLLLICLAFAVVIASVAAQTCREAPPSKLCKFPASGNIKWFVSDGAFNNCRTFNDPEDFTFNETKTTDCKISRKCLKIVAQYYCSSFCGGCNASDDKPLPPCDDICLNYTACQEKHGEHCIPKLPKDACAHKNSSDSDSYKYCNVLSIQEKNFLDGGEDSSAAASLVSTLGLAVALFWGILLFL